MAILRQRTTRDLLNKIKRMDEGIYHGVMELRNTYPDLMDMTRREAKELQDKALLSIVREERPAHNGYIYKIK